MTHYALKVFDKMHDELETLYLQCMYVEHD